MDRWRRFSVALRSRGTMKADGDSAQKASLKHRKLRKPTAWGISDIGISVSSRSRLALWPRRVAATSVGVAPVWRTNSRNKWRGPIPSRSASSATEASFRNPSSIRRIARATVVAVPFHAGLPGAASGRQRRHGRKPARSGCGCRTKERDVGRTCRPHRADRSAIDPRRPDASKE
jgi:hypothetical protein